jgi:hypothetical protein
VGNKKEPRCRKRAKQILINPEHSPSTSRPEITEEPAKITRLRSLLARDYCNNISTYNHSLSRDNESPASTTVGTIFDIDRNAVYVGEARVSFIAPEISGLHPDEATAIEGLRITLTKRRCGVGYRAGTIYPFPEHAAQDTGTVIDSILDSLARDVRRTPNPATVAA